MPPEHSTTAGVVPRKRSEDQGILLKHMSQLNQRLLGPWEGFHVRRDKLPSIAYSEELISFAMSTSLQSTDRHHGIVGQEHCHFQRDS
jgi:hypothetical protein